ncbi:MAG: type II toxin-antitoxin system PemK/MazF family toxin [Acidobacteria bacterium]|jgi:mRNA interferase MazF|nr:type II toxin-antitoxin system PemK/MazF family toxin [Acidobacteriota bacterium]MBA3784858.1 type II toxin-antitoxin system PemK/MazF family toxin [Acidobacteriota bacterium]MBA4121201.1 type II toxin-antitoxin system PemK/MazF family toxin [Acidobacteriota bacterium]MBA4185755.1 type II toxin-antitoxin system PemK/MazF family toxin [Acidobacteriota bacterium]
MGRFIKGDVVVTPFPFSDLTANKKRPALVIADLTGDDIIICLITSQNAKDNYAISLASNDLANGQLRQDSNIRPNRLFTIDAKIVLYRIGTLKREKTEKVTEKIIEIFS